MNSGALKYVIDIYGKAGTQNASGYIGGEPGKLFSGIRAKRMDASTREVWEAAAAKAKNIVNWEIRYREGVAVGQIVKNKGNSYEIIAVQRPEGVPRRMILKTTLKEAK